MSEGALSAQALTEACLDRIEAVDPQIHAWAQTDRRRAVFEARARDRRRADGLPLSAMHGIPVGLKDIIDVQGFATGNGIPRDADNRPTEDASIVRRLRDAGAVIVGKTVTTELAYFHPGATRNPHDPERTPGGSSSGSAAAVAAGMVPFAVGTQTNGSVIRPASFCGVVGYKPSYGTVPRTGILRAAPSLDQVGFFARRVEDVALAGELMGPDDRDPDYRLNPGPLLTTTLSEPPLAPDLAMVETPFWDRTDADTRDGFAELLEVLGVHGTAAELPEVFGRGAGWLATVMAAEMARNLGHYADADPVSAAFQALVEQGRSIHAVDYLAARDMQAIMRDSLEPLFERFDAILTPAAPGEAPRDLNSTGDPIFSTLWTFCGLPAVTLPLLAGENGLPIGVQLIGPYGQDAKLLRTARWLTRLCASKVEESG
nr:amidase [Spiribacter vilamensis]